MDMETDLHLPPFLLKSVNPKNVLADYIKGVYSTDKTVKYSSSIILPDVGTTHKQDIPKSLGSDPNLCCVYIRKSPQAVYEVYTTNHDNFIVSVSTAKPTKKYKANVVHKKRMCIWCRRDLDSEDTYPIPIPVKMKLHENTRYFYGSDRIYCTDRCASAMLDELLQDKANSALYSESRTLLRHLHYLLTGEEKIVSSPHWSLLENNGGPMGAETYYSTQNKYRKNPNIIFVPVKIQYETKVSNI